MTWDFLVLNLVSRGCEAVEWRSRVRGRRSPSFTQSNQEATMRYEKPEFVEIKMDAEIGSYQSDFDPDPIRFTRPAPAERADAAGEAE
ncbi:hypothetical protein BE17_01605 [Sorangium cellulosum]|uniref:Uncharacterized protein n=1 Tax=Sorangium cellulosum TaxID=56 RepID=A0A150RMI5_SORCE|nr:hypothetical protein BE17_01605 [Sorangium cellulosum]